MSEVQYSTSTGMIPLQSRCNRRKMRGPGKSSFAAATPPTGPNWALARAGNQKVHRANTTQSRVFVAAARIVFRSATPSSWSAGC